MTYYYPDNLRSQATIWLWSLRDVGIIAAILIVGLIALAKAGISMILILGVTYGIMTMRREDVTVMDFIVWAFCFFVTEQQFYEWRMSDGNVKKTGQFHGAADRP